MTDIELKDWIEMKNFQTNKYGSSVWIPLYETSDIKEGEVFHNGYTNTVSFLKSVLINKFDFDKLSLLNWSNLGTHSESSVFADKEGNYIPCDELDKSYYEMNGIFPVLINRVGHNLPEVWSLHHDIEIALKLYREGDIWICPDEDYVEVVRLLRDDERKPVKLEIKNEFLKDYLCARNMGAVLTYYQSHEKYLSEKPHFGWTSENETKSLDNGRWKGIIYETTTTGNTIGSEAFVMHLNRNDINKNEDVPVIGIPTNDNITGESKTVFLRTGDTVFQVSGEIWKNELILPGNISTRVRGDEAQNYPFFKIDAIGSEKTANQLSEDGRWLWFKPNLANILLEKRDGYLEWYTRETGSISCSDGYFVHFGINEKDLITVYAEDISLLPVWQQKIWAGFNVAPDGKVSKELLMAQVDAVPAKTQAAEEFLQIEYNRLNELFEKLFGFPLFRTQDEITELFPKLHRFRSLFEDGFYSLAKDLARITADAICTKEIQKMLNIPEKERWGSLKSLQNFLIQKIEIDEETAKRIMSPLFGIYDMRQVDAHLGDATKNSPYTSLGISKDLSPLLRGQQMLEKFVTTLCVLQKCINNWNNAK